MSLEDDDDRPRRDIFQFLPIGLAALLTLAAVGLCFVTIRVPVKVQTPAPPPAVAPASAPGHAGEVTIGIGAGSVIHPKQPGERAAPPPTAQ